LSEEQIQTLERYGERRPTEIGDVVFREGTATTTFVVLAFLIRRWMIIGLGAGLRIVGSRFCPDTRRLCEFAARNRTPYRWIDLEDDPEAEALPRELGISPEETPVVIWRGEQVLRPRRSRWRSATVSTTSG
jgi:thioredoxin reductase (NADPH)